MLKTEIKKSNGAILVSSLSVDQRKILKKFEFWYRKQKKQNNLINYRRKWNKDTLSLFVLYLLEEKNKVRGVSDYGKN